MSRLTIARAGNRRAARMLRAAVPGVALFLLCTGQAPVDAGPPSTAIKAQTVYFGDGRIVKGGTILVRDGRIAAVGVDVQVPSDTPVIEIDGGCVTPGLIDANARIESVNLIAASRKRAEQGAMGGSSALAISGFTRADKPPRAPHTVLRQSLTLDGSPPEGPETTRDDIEQDPGEILGRGSGSPIDADEHPTDGYETFHVGPPGDEPPLAPGVRSNAVVNEQGSEVVPQIRVLDSLDLRSTDFERLLRGGVTTVYASPDPSAVIGARGAVLHTGGAADRRVLREAGGVKAVIGSDPSTFGTYNRSPSRGSLSMYARRPNSRMGLIWVFRKAFYDAGRRGRGLEAYGSDTASPEASAVLRAVLSGKVPLRIQARIQQDILAALRLAEEFKLRFTLEEATEAYLCLDELREKSVPVVFGPIYEQPSGIRQRSGEGRRSRYYTFRALIESGIETALSAQELRDEDGLARQVMYAMRFGVGFNEALKAVTQTPAKMMGIDDQLGTLQAGKRADLVVWSGRPFAATSMPVVVMIDGRVVVDRR